MGGKQKILFSLIGGGELGRLPAFHSGRVLEQGTELYTLCWIYINPSIKACNASILPYGNYQHAVSRTGCLTLDWVWEES